MVALGVFLAVLALVAVLSLLVALTRWALGVTRRGASKALGWVRRGGTRREEPVPGTSATGGGDWRFLGPRAPPEPAGGVAAPATPGDGPNFCEFCGARLGNVARARRLAGLESYCPNCGAEFAGDESAGGIPGLVARTL